jgi:hypothetical protein
MDTSAAACPAIQRPGTIHGTHFITYALVLCAGAAGGMAALGGHAVFVPRTARHCRGWDCGSTYNRWRRGTGCRGGAPHGLLLYGTASDHYCSDADQNEGWKSLIHERTLVNEIIKPAMGAKTFGVKDILLPSWK